MHYQYDNKEKKPIYSNTRFYYEPYNPKIYNDGNETYLWAITNMRNRENSYYKEYVNDVPKELFEAYKKGKLSEEGFKDSVSIYHKK